MLLALFLAGPMKAQECGPETVNFKDGEELIYDVYYNWSFLWIPAGEAKFTLREHDDHYSVEVEGRNFPSYENLFRVRDRFQSRFDKETLLPSEFLRTIEEGNYRKFDSLHFDRDLGVVSKLQGKNKNEAEWSEDQIHSCAHDLLSVMYKLRTLDMDEMNKGDKVKVDIYFDDKMYPINLSVGKRKTKKIKNIGKAKTIQVSPELISGTVFNEDDHMNIWVSDDDNKIPLLIESPIKVGSVKVILRSMNGTMYEPSYLK